MILILDHLDITLSHRLAEANHGKPTAVFPTIAKLSVTTSWKTFRQASCPPRYGRSCLHRSTCAEGIWLSPMQLRSLTPHATRPSLTTLKKNQSKWKVNPRCSVPILPKVFFSNFQPSSFLEQLFQLLFLGSHHSPQPAAPTYLHRAGLATARHPETRNIWRW